MKKRSRSYERRMTPEAKILRYMRMSRGLSLRTIGTRLNLSDTLISHYEHGRCDLPKGRTGDMVSAYGYTMKDFQEYLEGKPIPVLSLKAECISLLERIDESKLRAVHAVLMNFTA